MNRTIVGLLLFLSVAAAEARERTAQQHFPILSNDEAWKALPTAEEGGGRPLPAWIRALARSLPRTAAAMIELDHAQREQSPLAPQLRAKLRWIAARANQCQYAMAYARADYVRAGGRGEEIDHLVSNIEKLPEAERLALRLVERLTEESYTVTDDEISRLVELYGEKQLVAIVLVAAYANFQDRLLLALGVDVEPEGPLPPLKVKLRRVGPPDKAKRKLTPPTDRPPPIPTVVDDPEWTAVSFDALRQHLSKQIERKKCRIPIPDWDAIVKNLPPDVPAPSRPTRIRWSLLNMAYQPRLTLAWSGGLRAFRGESDLPVVQQETMFWVVTRSQRCFY
jgi:alkylhydroperoxidase family enzyme